MSLDALAAHVRAELLAGRTALRDLLRADTLSHDDRIAAGRLVARITVQLEPDSPRARRWERRALVDVAMGRGA